MQNLWQIKPMLSYEQVWHQGSVQEGYDQVLLPMWS